MWQGFGRMGLADGSEYRWPPAESERSEDETGGTARPPNTRGGGVPASAAVAGDGHGGMGVVA